MRLDELGTVTDGAAEPRTFTRLFDEPIVAFGVSRAKGASDVTVDEKVAARLAEIQAAHPEIKFAKVDTQVDNELGNYHSTMETLIEGAALAVVVVFMFLRDSARDDRHGDRVAAVDHPDAGRGWSTTLGTSGTALRRLRPPPRVPPPGKSPVGPSPSATTSTSATILGGVGFTAVESTALEVTVRAPASAVVDVSLLPFMGVAPERAGGGSRGRAPSRAVRVGPDVYEYPLAFRVYEARNNGS